MLKKIIFNAGVAVLAIILPCRQSLAWPGKETAQQKLSRVKVAVLYENITDGVNINRSIADTVKLLQETRTDFIFRGFWKWTPVLESPDDIPAGFQELAGNREFDPERAAQGIRKSGHYYQELQRWVSAIKKEMPELIFCGAVPAQQLFRIDHNPLTKKLYTAEETWAMALDPRKWNIRSEGKAITKEQLQGRLAGRKQDKDDKNYDRRKAASYFPDITNPDFQELLLSWAEKQIDCGADAIWIDMLYTQAKLFLQITGDSQHPAIKESLAGIAKIVDRIHEYGASKEKYIYVGTWGQSYAELGIAYTPADLDFATISPTKEEVLNKSLDYARWEDRINSVSQVYGDIPIFAFIDWSQNVSPTVTFSQKLSKEEQGEALRAFDRSCSELGVNFVYPLHGGYMGNAASRLSFGNKRVYDSLAPEFNTYPTIKDLARNKNL